MKTMTDCWVVGRKSDQRELYVVLNQKNANLIDVNGKPCLFDTMSARITVRVAKRKKMSPKLICRGPKCSQLYRMFDTKKFSTKRVLKRVLFIGITWQLLIL